MTKYFALTRIHFINGLQYRTAALAGVATQFAWGFLELLMFSSFYRANPDTFPMDFSQLASYIWLQQALLAIFVIWLFDNEIFSSITNGSIAYELARPMDLYLKWFSSSVASRLSKVALRCVPIFAVVFFLPDPYRLNLPPDIKQASLFLLSSVLGLGVVVSVNMLIYISAFYTLSPIGIRNIVAILADFLAGAYMPLVFFPEPFRFIAELLPFASIQNMPFRIYSGNISGFNAAQGIVLQAFWLCVLIFLGRVTINKALKRVIVQGG